MATRKVEPLYLACDGVQTCFTWLGAFLNGALILWCSFWLVTHYAGIEVGWIYFFAAFFVGLFLTDFMSGLVHWGTDTWFDEIQLERVVSIAREHHIYPHHITGYGFRDYVGYSSWPTVLVVAPILLPLTLSGEPSDSLYLATFVLTEVSVFMIFGSYTHRLGHMRTRSRVARLLQRYRLIISPAYHKVHHSGLHDIRYCVFNGWANPLCDRLRFWRLLESLISFVTGAAPQRQRMVCALCPGPFVYARSHSLTCLIAPRR